MVDYWKLLKPVALQKICRNGERLAGDANGHGQDRLRAEHDKHDGKRDCRDHGDREPSPAHSAMRRASGRGHAVPPSCGRAVAPREMGFRLRQLLRMHAISQGVDHLVSQGVPVLVPFYLMSPLPAGMTRLGLLLSSS